MRTLHAAFDRWFTEIMKASFGGEIPEEIRNLPADLDVVEWIRAIRARAMKPSGAS